MQLDPPRPVDHLVLGIGTFVMAAMQLILPRPGWVGPALFILLALQALFWLWLAKRGAKNRDNRGTRPDDRFIGMGLAAAAATVLFAHYRERFAFEMGLIVATAGLWSLWRGVRGLAVPEDLRVDRKD